ncbi:delta-type opioid receptor-like [Asterias rubens]|uniref:Somatostatin receptor 2 n=1 Tax=Asterias rubens TaxID=7604 RepID=A0A6G8J3P0_ASTRU|nr:delta-type opioid receptor-like [Asterias rubens]QIM61771.1 somatostatin receptor 2 [Asterias rubens]
MEPTVTETYTSLYPMNVTDFSTLNLTEEEEEEEGNFSDIQLAGTIIGSLYMIITIVGILGNGTVIYVVLRFAKMKTVTNCYILNLAVADAVFVTFLTLMAVSNFMETYWIFGAFLCKVYFGIDMFNMVISVWCLTAMSVDRYVAVCHAMKSRSFRNLPIATAINASTWLLSILAAIPFVYFAKLEPGSGNYDVCYLYFEPDRVKTSSQIMAMCVFIFNFVIPLTVIIVCYASITMRLRDMNKKTGKPEKSRKVNRLVLIVVITFVICWAPFYIVKILFVFVDTFRRWNKTWILSDITMSLTYINSCANPFLYAFFSDNFRKSFRKAWLCHSRNQAEVSQTSYASRWKFGKSGGKGKFNKKGKRFRLHDDEGDDTNVSGYNNQYPLTATAVTSVVSESSYPRNGEMSQVNLDKQAVAKA